MNYPQPAGVPATPPPTGPVRETPGFAIASLILGILSLAGMSLLIVPPILAIVFGHIAHSRISKDSRLTGSGLAIAGFVMGYASIVIGIFMAGLFAAMAVPAFAKVRESSLQKMLDNDARQIASAAQQYMLDHNVETVRFNVDPLTGKVDGPLSEYVVRLSKGTVAVDAVFAGTDDGFSLSNPQLMNGREVKFDAMGRRLTRDRNGEPPGN